MNSQQTLIKRAIVTQIFCSIIGIVFVILGIFKGIDSGHFVIGIILLCLGTGTVSIGSFLFLQGMRAARGWVTK